MSDATEPEIEPTSICVLEPHMLAPGQSVMTEAFWMAHGSYHLIASRGDGAGSRTPDCLAETFGSIDGEAVGIAGSTRLECCPVQSHVVRFSGTPGYYVTLLTNLGTACFITVEASLVHPGADSERAESQ
jgi:hypothetical protein